MTEQQMPARIWAHSNGQNYWLDYQPTYTRPTEFIRADIAERMAEALRDMSCPRPCNGRPRDFEAGKCFDAGECGCVAGSALSAFKDSATGGAS